MKKLILIPLIAAGLFVGGCKINEKAAELVEKSYSVANRGAVAIEYVIGQLDGSELGLKVIDDLQSVQSALDALKTTLETIAPFVGAELQAVEESSLDPINDLDKATEDLIRSLEKIE